jgi:hypothetical protein
MSLGRISRENTKNLDAFTPVFFERITKNCSSYIRIVLPVILGLVLSGQTNLRILQEVERVSRTKFTNGIDMQRHWRLLPSQRRLLGLLWRYRENRKTWN